MSEMVADFQTVAGRLGALENELHQLRDLLVLQVASVTPAEHPYVTRAPGILKRRTNYQGHAHPSARSDRALEVR